MKSETRIRTVELTIEKCETFTIRRTRTTVEQWCGECGDEVGMSNPEDAATIVGVSTRTVYSAIETGDAHFTEFPDGSLLVCLRSLDENGARPQLFEGELEQS